MVLMLTTLFISCDVDKNKVADAVDGAIEDAKEMVEPTSAEIGDVDIAFCDTKVENHHGCHCTFKDDNGTSIFLSNMDQDKSACISINGKTEILYGMRSDERHDHYRHSYIPDWIILDPDGEVHIFNELVDDANYDENKDMIAQTMMVMHDIPKEMKIRKNTDGGEVSAEMSAKYEKMWNEAYEYATSEREKGNHGEPMMINLSNETYDVSVKAQVGAHHEDGSDDYSGTIEVKNKSGKVIGSKDFKGVCICED